MARSRRASWRPPGLTVIVGEEVKTADGDLICLFLERGHPARAVGRGDDRRGARAGRASSGIPHPFDRLRGSLLRDERLAALGASVDWVETPQRAASSGAGNERAAAYAREHGLPGVAVSDAHSILEVGVAYTELDGRPIDGRRPARGAATSPASSSCPGGRAWWSVPGRQSPRPSSAAAATGGSSRRRATRGRPIEARRLVSQSDRDGARRATHLRAGHRGRPAVAVAPAPPAADDHLDPDPARGRSPGSSCSTASSSARVPGLIAEADVRLVALAFLVFYAGLPASWRCAGRSCCVGPASQVSTRDSTEIIFLSWLVNCVVPGQAR